MKLGVDNAESLLAYYPVHYDLYTKPEPISGILEGRKCAILAYQAGNIAMHDTGRLKIISVDVQDATGRIRVCWYNAPYIRQVIKRGKPYVLRGVAKRKQGFLVLEHPEIFQPEDYEKKVDILSPVYGLTKGLSNNMVQKAVRAAFAALPGITEYLPDPILKAYGLMDLARAAWSIHFPPDYESFMQARSRLAFDEFFLFILAIRHLRQRLGDAESAFAMHKFWETEDFIEKLPYALTRGQMNIWREIEADLSSGRRMARLIQGDVGSGKTVLAFLAMYMAALNGYQSVLMAPTEVLARQHYEKLQGLLAEQGITGAAPVLLTGSLKAGERKMALRLIEEGSGNLIIGTHALIQKAVRYKNLALVITDEQHRFGVYQRQVLGEREDPPHMMVMSATPIPRTLGVVFYGDLDVSVLSELPAKRLPIKNCVVDSSFRPNAMRFIRKELDAGHQVYIICPMIEPQEGIDAENVTEYVKKMRKAFPDANVACLHGRMKPDEKTKVMEEFSAGQVRALVSTTVVEVGVDVPNATVMMIENAERFGLAALHQLRGRVGRGESQSYCIFMAGQQGEDIRKRLDILNHSNDGFEIAEKDFELRGPGDLLGFRQSGDASFRIADITRDRDLLEKAGNLAGWILKDSSRLYEEEFMPLRRKLEDYLKENEGSLTI